MNTLEQIVRLVARRVGERRTAQECGRVVGDVAGPLRPGLGAAVRLSTPLLGSALVMPEADGTASFVLLQPAESAPVRLGDLSSFGTTTKPYLVSPVVQRRVRFETPVDGCLVTADLDDDDRVTTVYVAREAT